MKFKVLAITASVVSAAVGGLVGYTYAMKKVVPDLERELENCEAEIKAQVAAAKEYYAKLYKAEGFSDPETVLQRRTPQVPEGFEHETPEEIEANKAHGPDEFVNQYHRPNTPFVVNEPKVPTQGGAKKSTNKARPKTYGNELPDDPGVGPKGVYVISDREYEEGELGYNQVQLTYYAGDDVLADTNEEPMLDVVDVVGPRALKMFGHKSNDPSLVYVRNELLCIDYEIAKSNMTYAEAVHGLTNED